MGGSAFRAILIVLVLVGGIAAGVLGGLYAAGVFDEDDNEVIQRNYGDTGADRLYLAGRDKFSICVDGVGIDLTEEQLEAVDTALDVALPRAVEISDGRLTGVPEQYSDPQFVRGCPDPKVLEQALDGHVLDYFERNTMRRGTFVSESGPDSLSPHRVWVYFVERETYAEAFGEERYIATSEEFVCESICWAVTRVFYVPADAGGLAIQDGFLGTLNLLGGAEILDLAR